MSAGTEQNRWIYDLIFCGECGVHVPVFRDLAPPDQELVDHWSLAKTPPSEIANETGLSEQLAKSWKLHRSKRIQRKGRMNSTPCPECGRWLRTSLANQCFHCGNEWHDQNSKTMN